MSQDTSPLVSVHEFAPIPIWWGKFHFEINQSRTWQFGSLVLRLTRMLNEWRLEYHRPLIQHDYEQEYKPINDVEYSLALPIQTERFMFRQTTPEIYLMPRLAPESVVIRPNIPVYIPSGQSTTFYISTPLWIRAYIHQPDDPLFELPVIQAKETWFGKTKQKGELCYVTAVDARTSLESLPPRAFRAVTPVRLQNNSLQQMRFERMKVPVTYLPLFYSLDLGRLITTHIQVRYDSQDDVPKVRISDRLLDSTGQVQQIHKVHEQNNLSNLFDLWI